MESTLDYARQALIEAQKSASASIGLPDNLSVAEMAQRAVDTLALGAESYAEGLRGIAIGAYPADIAAGIQAALAPDFQRTLQSVVDNPSLLLARVVLPEPVEQPALPEPVEVEDEPDDVEPDEPECERCLVLDLVLEENDALRAEKAQLQEELDVQDMLARLDFGTMRYPDLDGEEFDDLERQP